MGLSPPASAPASSPGLPLTGLLLAKQCSLLLRTPQLGAWPACINPRRHDRPVTERRQQPAARLHAAPRRHAAHRPPDQALNRRPNRQNVNRRPAAAAAAGRQPHAVAAATKARRRRRPNRRPNCRPTAGGAQTAVAGGRAVQRGGARRGGGGYPGSQGGRRQARRGGPQVRHATGIRDWRLVRQLRLARGTQRGTSDVRGCAWALACSCTSVSSATCECPTWRRANQAEVVQLLQKATPYKAAWRPSGYRKKEVVEKDKEPRPPKIKRLPPLPQVRRMARA